MKAIRVDAPGGPEAMRLADVPDPQPRDGEALVHIDTAGVNFIDVYHRTAAYSLPFPLVPGVEGAGTVVAVGDGVTEVAVGDRVAFSSGSGTYAELVSVPAARLVPIPQGVSTKQAASAMLQGMTAHYLATSTFALKPGDTCLVHAAAGGVGLLLSQIAKLRGARVIGTVSTEEKGEIAREEMPASRSSTTASAAKRSRGASTPSPCAGRSSCSGSRAAPSRRSIPRS